MDFKLLGVPQINIKSFDIKTLGNGRKACFQHKQGQSQLAEAGWRVLEGTVGFFPASSSSIYCFSEEKTEMVGSRVLEMARF
jgi:hypothetical protein